MGFIDDYESYARRVTDAPGEYHETCGLSVVSTVLGNRVFLGWGAGPLRCNLWQIIIGESSRWRKTTCLGLAKQVVRAAAPGYCLPEQWSTESLMKELSQNPGGTVFYPEWRTFAEFLRRDYAGGAKSLLTELYDGPVSIKRVLLGGTVEVRDAAPGLLCASTMSWFEKNVNDADREGGFLARFLVNAPDAPGELMAVPRKADPEAFKALVAYAGWMANLVGEFQPTDAFIADYRAWFKKWVAENETGDCLLDSMVHRAAITALKLSMLYSVSEGAVWQLDAPALAKAANYLSRRFADAVKVFATEAGGNEFERRIRTLRKMVSAAVGITRGELLHRLRWPTKDLDQVLQVLLQEGFLHETRVPTKGREKIVYLVSSEEARKDAEDIGPDLRDYIRRGDGKVPNRDRCVPADGNGDFA